MYVNRIIKFIDRLRACDGLAEYDRAFLQKFEENYLSLDVNQTLSQTQLAAIEQAFSDRWNAIADKNDYTVNPNDINRCWIELAVALEEDLYKSFLQILFPKVKNVTDLKKLANLDDTNVLQTLYIGERGDLDSVPKLLERYRKRELFCTYSTNADRDKYVLRPLSLQELLRIRLKTEDVPFEFDGKQYMRYWDCIEKRIAPDLCSRGELPKHLLLTLLEAVDLYFDGKRDEFNACLISLSKYLQECHIDDVNNLYGQAIRVNREDIFLVNILLDGLQGDVPGLDDKMFGVARWLCTYDPSLIGQSLALKSAYDSLKVGPAFDINQLILILNELRLNSCSPGVQSINLLLKLVEGKESIDPKIVAALGVIYRLRWEQERGGPRDYTRLQDGVNKKWIYLAQLLAGSGHLKDLYPNYYFLLMPTLDPDIAEDLTQKECLTAYPLSHYVLSVDGRILINLVNCEKYYESNGRFYNCNATPPRPLTPEEIVSLSYTQPRFRRYVPLASCSVDDDPPIALSTVLAIKAFVEASLFISGLGFDYDELETAAANNAFLIFSDFLRRLPDDERKRLYAQLIVSKGVYMSFYEVLQKIEKEGCIAFYGLHLAQLVMDYLPYIKFNHELEDHGVIDEARENSRRKVCRDNVISDAEAKRRIQILAVSMMTHPFLHYPGIAATATFWDSSNYMAQVVQDIYALTLPMITTGNYKHACYVYHEALESVVKPAIADTRVLTWIIRNSATQNWLKSISNQTLFNQKNTWFDPALLMTILLPMALKPSPIRIDLQNFLDDLVQTYAQNQPDSLKEIRVNIKFVELLNKLQLEHKEQLLEALRGASKELSKQPIPIEVFLRLCFNFVTHRLTLASPPSTTRKYQTDFFGVDRTLTKKLDIKRILTAVDDRYTLTSVAEMLKTLKHRVGKIDTGNCDEATKLRMKRFLYQLERPIIPISNEPTQPVSAEFQYPSPGIMVH